MDATFAQVPDANAAGPDPLTSNDVAPADASDVNPSPCELTSQQSCEAAACDAVQNRQGDFVSCREPRTDCGAFSDCYVDTAGNENLFINDCEPEGWLTCRER
jgi:hypothetical protein